MALLATTARLGEPGARECQRGSKERACWLVDSGCTSHMVSSGEGLTDIRWGKGRVIVAGGEELESVGAGSINGVIKTRQGESRRIVFKDVLIVPGLGGRSLLSVKRIVDLGGKVTFSLSNAAIEINGVELPMRSTTGDALYEVEYRRLDPGAGGVKEQRAFMAAAEDARELGIKTRSGGHRKIDHIEEKNARQESGKRNIELTSFSVRSEGIGKTWSKRKTRRKQMHGTGGRGGSHDSRGRVRHVSKHWKRRKNLASVGDRRADEQEEYKWEESATWKRSTLIRQRCRERGRWPVRRRSDPGGGMMRVMQRRAAAAARSIRFSGGFEMMEHSTYSSSSGSSSSSNTC